MRDDIERKISLLRKRYLEDDMAQRALEETEQDLRKHLALSSFGQGEIPQMLIKESKEEIARINMLLLNDRTLTEEQRIGLFHERDVHTFWLQRLDPKEANRSIEEIASFVDSELDN